MTRKQKIMKTVITMSITVVMTVIVLWLRSGDSLASSISSINIMGVSYSVTDFFVIITAGICGYRYGLFVFIAALVAQFVYHGDVMDGLFSLLIYFVISIVAGYFAEKRWYKTWWKTLLSVVYLTVILGGSWYIVSIQHFTVSSDNSTFTLFQMLLGALPEVAAAVLVQSLFLCFAPDKIKRYVGKCYVYTKEYEQSNEFRAAGSSVLRRQVTMMTMSEALLLSVFAVVISNAQVSQMYRSQRERAYQMRTIYISGEALSGTDSGTSSDTQTDSVTDSGAETGGSGKSDTNTVSYAATVTDSDTGTDNRSTSVPDYKPSMKPEHAYELSDDQMQRLTDNFALDNHEILIMDIQLWLIVMCIAMPLGMFFNSLMLKRVVFPIKTLSGVMNDYFSEDESRREELLGKLKEIKLRGKDNEINMLSASMQRMIDDMTNYIHAVEHEKQLESELQIAEARCEAKSLFLSNMSHEIRTPINAVLGMNEMILRESREPNTIEYAENVRNAGNTLLGLVNDILDFSKIEAGKLDIIPVDYDLASVLNDLVTMIQTRADNKGLILNVNVDPALPVHLHGDEIRIKQVATNILTNAVKYTEKGSVTISVSREKLPEEDGSDAIGLRFVVSDTGIGIKPEDMDKLFTAFERIEEERNRTIEGTGLGMNITQRLLDMMGSRLEVESEYGKGSTFAFTVKQQVVSDTPIGNYEESYRRTLAERKLYKEKFTAPDAEVLVVDDTRMNLAVFRSLLKKTRVKIDTAESGNECLMKAAAKKYDIIFLDHRMPEKDGIETLKELIDDKDGPNIDTPVICLTANAVSGAREEYIKAGFFDYLTKPIDPDRLEAALMKYLPQDKVITGTDTEIPADNASAAAPEDTGGIPEWLFAVDAIDTAEGIRHCGDPEIYMETLTVYAESAAESADEIERLWGERDIPNVTVKVHALKSTSRVIGAMKLGDLAEKLEKAGNAEDIGTLTENIGKLLGDYRDLTEALSPLLDNGDDSSLPEIPLEKLHEAYDAIRELAEVFDYDSVLFVMDSLSGQRAPEEEREKFAALRSAVAKPDWDMIKKVLSE